MSDSSRNSISSSSKNPVDMKTSEPETSTNKSKSNTSNDTKSDDTSSEIVATKEGEDEEANAEEKEEDEDDGEKSYLKKADQEQDMDEEQKAKNECFSISSTSTSSTSGDSFNSSLSNSSAFNRLKGILKKPRSCSESESTATFYNQSERSLTNEMKSNYMSSSSSNSNSVGSDIDSAANLSSSKKSVSFNKQVVRNVFKPGSTVIGMKKPGSGKNKKKNKRNRTVSDPSHDSNADAVSLKAGESSAFRTRSFSESSDDGMMTNSNESLQEAEKSPPEAPKQQSQAQTADANTASSKNKKKKKKKNNKATNATETPAKDCVKEAPKPAATTTPFNMETMLEWKNQGRLPLGDVTHVTNSAIKLKNSLINDLDD